MYTYNTHNEGKGLLKLRYIWSPKNKPYTLEGFYGNITKDFKGNIFKVTTLPWSHHVIADKVPKDRVQSEDRKYENHRGYEFTMMNFMKEAFNCKYEVINPPDGNWGGLENGSWNGLTGYSARDDADVSVSGMFYTWARSQVMASEIFFGFDYIIIASPTPKQVPKFLAIVNPFDHFVWLSVIVSSIIVSTILFPLISRFENQMLPPRKDCNQARPNLTFLYGYGCVLGESMTDETTFRHGRAIR